MLGLQVVAQWEKKIHKQTKLILCFLQNIYMTKKFLQNEIPSYLKTWFPTSGNFLGVLKIDNNINLIIDFFLLALNTVFYVRWKCQLNELTVLFSFSFSDIIGQHGVWKCCMV